MTTTPPLLKTALHALHLEHGAKMVPFAGYDMPVQYPLGILKEHLHTRAQAGLFDVSHMGQVILEGATAAEELERLVPVDVIDLPIGMQRYALFTRPEGGILDDLMITRYGEQTFYIVVNAACKEQDIAHLQQHISAHCTLTRLDNHALMALQGPKASAVLARHIPEAASLVFMHSLKATIKDIPCAISRSGYTGEDGYEISVHNTHAETLARLLLAEPEVEAIGLGARDSLRLEAGLCLYGHDIHTETTPIEAQLLWAISKVRRPDGARAGRYAGSDIIESQLQQGVSQKRVGFIIEDRVPVREGATIVDTHGNTIGHITSGGFSPTLGHPIAMGYVNTEALASAQALAAIVRGKPVALKVTKMPFVPARYYRG
jgi:aminomethyltransferase